jgi:hypothetical protein
LVSVGVAGGLDEFVVVAVNHCWHQSADNPKCNFRGNIPYK